MFHPLVLIYFTLWISSLIEQAPLSVSFLKVFQTSIKKVGPDQRSLCKPPARDP